LKDYVLVIGTALSFDEAEILRRLDNIISKNLNLFSSLKIIYRPHPYRQGKDTIIEDRLENVKIDPRVFKAYKTGNKNFHPNL
jgi:hypothetical protein